MSRQDELYERLQEQIAVNAQLFEAYRRLRRACVVALKAYEPLKYLHKQDDVPDWYFAINNLKTVIEDPEMPH